MEPPLKRPRLSIFANEPPNVELDTARHYNDQHLKGRFEAIFEKYERDFAGVGDEVDLATGDIVVDNGHLASLAEDADTRSEADESDVEPSPARSAVASAQKKLITDGRSMLRAMTVAPDREDAYFDNENADDVIESIEMIAENAGLAEAADADSESDEGEADNASEDDHRNDSAAGSGEGPRIIHQNVPDTADSDHDSLFGIPDERASSPDSLFEQPTAASSATPGEEIRSVEGFFDDIGDLDHEAVIARFGQKAGQEVLDLIQKRDKAELHIEAAWRIPVQIEPRAGSVGTPPKLPGFQHLSAGIFQGDSTPKQTTSLWSLGRQTKSRLEIHQDRTMRVIRAESEDPLQEGFGDSGHVEVRVAEMSLDRATRLLKRGMCPFCKEEYFNLIAVTEHLNGQLAKLEHGSTDAESHSADRIEELLSNLPQASGHEEEDDDTSEAEPDHDEDAENTTPTQQRPVVQSVESDVKLMDDGIVPDETPDGTGVVSTSTVGTVVISDDAESDSNESVDDLFFDAGYSQTNLLAGKGVEASVTPKEQASNAFFETRRAGSGLRDGVPRASPTPARSKRSSNRRQNRRFLRGKEAAAETRPSGGLTPEYESLGYPEFRETADPFDRDGSRSYRGRATELEQSLLSLRPRKTKRNVSYTIAAKPPAQKRGKKPAAEAKSRTKEKGKPASEPSRSSYTSKAFGRTDANDVDTTNTRGVLSSGPQGAASDPSNNEQDTINAAFEVVDSEHDTAVLHQGYSQDSGSDREDSAETEYSPPPVYHFTVSDFKCLVLHHEAEYSDLAAFGEIMTNHYYNYRLPVDPLSRTEMQSDWSENDEALLHSLSRNPETLMETIKRRLHQHNQFDIGNRLAERWLMEASAGIDALPEVVPEPRLLLPGQSSFVRRGNTHQILDLADSDAVIDNYDDVFVSRGRTAAREPLRSRICREMSPSGIWRGCGRVYSQRSAVYRHWKTTNRACMFSGYNTRLEARQKQRIRATKEDGHPCRSTSPGGTVRGCERRFRQKSTLYRHWRTNGVKCRPAGVAASDLNTSDAEEVPESDHGQGNAITS